MALDDVGEGVLEGGDVQCPGEPIGDRQVVGRRRAFELPQEPQPLLREGHRQLGGPGDRTQRRARPAGMSQPDGQLGDGGCLEHRPQGQFAAQRPANPRQQAHREQRITAQREEVVVDAHPGHAEQVREKAAQHRFPLVAGRSPGSPASPGSGQGAVVDLVVGRQRQLVDRDDGGGHHVLGQRAFGQLAHRADVHGRARLRDDVGDEPLVAGQVLANGDDDLAEPWVAGEDRLDLARLHPEAPDLDLTVRPALELQQAAGVPAREVAGAVHPRAGRPGGIGDEPLGGQAGPVQVAAGQARACQVQLTCPTRRDR